MSRLALVDAVNVAVDASVAVKSISTKKSPTLPAAVSVDANAVKSLASCLTLVTWVTISNPG